MKLKTVITDLIILSTPILLGQLGLMLISVGDTLIAGKHSTNTLAAIGLATSVTNPVLFMGIGLAGGISSKLAILRGEGKDVTQYFSSILLYTLVIGLCLIPINFILASNIEFFGFAKELNPIIAEYIRVVSWSFPFVTVCVGIKEYLQSFENVKFANIFYLVMSVLNVGLNYILVFGSDFNTGMGEVGLAVASVTIRIVSLVTFIAYSFNMTTLTSLDFPFMYRLFKFCAPIAFMFLTEVLAFCTIAILSGQFEVYEAAANNVIMQYASLMFMIPLSFGSAASVKVGHAYGQHNSDLIKKNIIAVLSLCVVFFCISTSMFLLVPRELMGIMSTEPQVIDLGVKLLLIVAIFQVADSLQVGMSGVLRGMNSTLVPSITILIAYWVVGLPFGYYLAFYKGMNVYGLWLGISISLGIMAITLAFYLHHKVKKLKF